MKIFIVVVPNLGVVVPKIGYRDTWVSCFFHKLLPQVLLIKIYLHYSSFIVLFFWSVIEKIKITSFGSEKTYQK